MANSTRIPKNPNMFAEDAIPVAYKQFWCGDHVDSNAVKGWPNAYCSRALMRELKDDWASMEWWMETRTADEDEFMFLELLLCKEVGIAYVMDYYGLRTTIWGAGADEIYRTSIPKTENCRKNFECIAEACMKMTGLKLVFYNKGHFNKCKTAHRDNINAQIMQVALIGKQMPTLCLSKIRTSIQPAWMRANIQQRLLRSREKYIGARLEALTYNMMLWTVFNRLIERKNRDKSGWIYCMDEGF
jgi:hypothetical protein